ncbi:hypothetical protein V8C26DRAFT_416683 [Trichoderma gracile]
MAAKITTSLLVILYMIQLAFSAPTGKITSLSPSTISTPSQHPLKQASGVTPNRPHLIRVSKTTSEETADPNKVFLDTTTLQLFETSHQTKPVSIFTSTTNNKVVINTAPEDSNGNIITSYHVQEKNNHINTPSAWNGRQAQILCRRLRQCRQRALEQRLGLLILGASLALAVVCACMRELCSLLDDERLELELGSKAVEEGMAMSSHGEKH